MQLKRLGIYVVGMVTVSVGIVLCAKCGLGISPVSCWPYMLEELVPLSFGTLTMLYHFINILFQYIAERKLVNQRVLFQVPLAIVLGVLIDLIKGVVQFDNTVLVNQAVALMFSIFFTAIGMACMINMNLIQNPPDGTVRQISIMSGIELGTIKLTFDIVMVATSSIASFLLLGYPRGFGIATVLSAVFVGKVLTVFQRQFGAKMRAVYS